MDLRSKSFLVIIIALIAIAVFALVQGLIPVAVLFAVFGAAGLVARHKVKKK